LFAFSLIRGWSRMQGRECNNVCDESSCRVQLRWWHGSETPYRSQITCYRCYICDPWWEKSARLLEKGLRCTMDQNCDRRFPNFWVCRVQSYRCIGAWNRQVLLENMHLFINVCTNDKRLMQTLYFGLFQLRYQWTKSITFIVMIYNLIQFAVYVSVM